MEVMLRSAALLFVGCAVVIGVPAIRFRAIRDRAVHWSERVRSSAQRRCAALLGRRRVRRAEEQLPELVILVGNALRAGRAMPQALQDAAAQLPPPLGEEMGRVVGELRLGCSVEEALGDMHARLPGEEIALFVWTIAALRRSGGNLVEACATLRETIEGRRRVADRIRVLTSQGIFQGAVLLLLPWALGALLLLIAPEFVAPLLRTRLGNAFVMTAVLLEAIGALWLRRIVVIRV